MTTLAQVAEYRSTMNELSTLAIADVNAVLRSLEGRDPVEVRNTLIVALPEVVGPYITTSGELTATWYEDLRRAAVGGTFYATALGAVNAQQFEALTRWGVKPLFGEGGSTVLSLLGGGVQRMVAGAGRDTIVGNTQRDRVRVGYARIPRSDCCAFCGMLASRGAVYNSRGSAGGVRGRGVDAAQTAGRRGGQGQGVKARGSRSVGSDKYHDFCRCVAAPVFVGDTFHQGVQKQFEELYRQTGGSDTKSTLASWREEHGTK